MIIKKQFIIYLLILIVILIFSLLLLGKKNGHPFYLKIRSITINKIEIFKNSSVFKSYFIYKGTKEARKNFKEINFNEKRKILLKNFLLDEEQVKFYKIKNNELYNIIDKHIERSKYLKNFTKNFGIRINQNSRFNISKPDSNAKIFKVTYYDINHYGILEESKKKNIKKKLIIYVQGHLGNPYNKKYYLDLKEYFIEKDYDIFSLGMIGRGFNYQANVKYPNSTNKDKLLTYNHENIKFFYDKNYPNKQPMSIFLSGNYFLIKNLLQINKYEEVIFVGVSSGGLYGKIFSSLINEIDSTYIFNGSAPCFLQIFTDTKGDWESCEKKLYGKINYWQFYKMASKNEINQNKQLILIYNKKDKCCFRDPTASIMLEISKKLNDDKFRVLTYSKVKFHGANLDLLISDLKLN